MTPSFDTVVIGAGVGGLTAAAVLADAGQRVLVLEQGEVPGGYCTSWTRQVRVGDERVRLTFDAGVHDVSGLGAGAPVRTLLDDLGIAGSLRWLRVDHAYVASGERLRVPPSVDALLAELARRAPGDAEGLALLFDELESLRQLLYLALDAPSGGGAVRQDYARSRAPRRSALGWRTTPFLKMLETYVRSPALRALLGVLTCYVGDDPRRVSAGAMAMVFGYYRDGGFYPAGGAQALPDALVAAIRARGGEVRVGAPVERILVADGRAVGVRCASGEVIESRAVVSNADLKRTFARLLDRDDVPRAYAEAVARLEPSAGAAAVFLGLKRQPDVAALTFVVEPGERALSIASMTALDPGLATAGYATLELHAMLPAAEAARWERGAEGYARRKRELGDALVLRAARELPGLEELIVYREDASPATFARYAGVTGGAMYGLAADAARSEATTPVRGLFLAARGRLRAPASRRSSSRAEWRRRRCWTSAEARARAQQSGPAHGGSHELRRPEGRGTQVNREGKGRRRSGGGGPGGGWRTFRRGRRADRAAQRRPAHGRRGHRRPRAERRPRDCR